MSPSTPATMAGPSQTGKTYLRQSTPSIRMLPLTSTTTPQPFASTSKNFQMIRAKQKTSMMNQVSSLRTNTLNKMNKLSTSLSQSRSKKLLKLSLVKIVSNNLLKGRRLNNSLIKWKMKFKLFRL
jgi:hypothetical protein